MPKEDSAVRQFFTDDQLEAIATRIGEIETRTAGEIRVVMRHRRDWFARLLHLPIRILAIEEFRRLGMQKTRDRTGVIMFFLLADRRFYIYGDRGLHRKVGQETWDRLVGEMSEQAKTAGLFDAVIYGLGQIGELLNRHFPIKPDDVNELPNDVVIR